MFFTKKDSLLFLGGAHSRKCFAFFVILIFIFICFILFFMCNINEYGHVSNF